LKKVTLQDIADQVGLSKFAVSRALSGKDGVSEDTRLRITGKAMEMGYLRAADVASAQPIIQIVFAEHDPVNSELWMQMQNGIQKEASAAGFQLQSHWAPDIDQATAIAAVGTAIVLVGQHGADIVGTFTRSGRAVVRLGWVLPLEKVDQVTGADHEAGNAVGQYLIARGHRRIAFVHGTRILRGRIERLFGLREAAMAESAASVREIQFSPEETFEHIFRGLDEQGERPTALFCSHDSLGVFVVSELHRMGYRVPDDVSVIGYGDFAAATQVSPMLTTLRLPGADMGIAAFRLLLDRMDSGRRQLPPQRLMLVPELIERESVTTRHD
jgi:LacI family transcriptional regulator